MKTRRVTRRTKRGNAPLLSRYRRKQMQHTAMSEAFSRAYEKARSNAGASGRDPAPARQGRRRNS